MLSAYLNALFVHWLWLLGAFPVLAERLAGWFFPGLREQFEKWPKRRTALLWIMAVCLFVASFLAWRDEYDRAHAAAKMILDPLVLYQDGFPGASVGNGRVDPATNSIYIETITATRNLDFNRIMEFRDWKVVCNGTPGAVMTFGAMAQANYNNVVCKIQGLR